MRSAIRVCLLTAACLLAAGAARAAELPQMKFNDVKEVAPGVFFRYSSISATDPTVPFGGCNNIWVVFEDYVVVIDANFQKEAADVLAAIKKTTDKPIRYVLDTHHHGDHAYGNAIFARAGASIVAQTNCARLLRLDGPVDFQKAAHDPASRRHMNGSPLKVPTVVFDDKLVLDDGKQRVEFLFLGHAHTIGDAFAYLPRQKILCTGDACVNGPYNYMGHSDSASWVRTLERAQQLDVDLVLPGHGFLAGKDLLEKQKRYFVELRHQVRAGIDAGKDLEEIAKGIDMPWYKEWTSVTPSGENVKFVYDEMTGRVAPWNLAEEFGIYAGPSPTKDTPGWKAPRRIVVPNLMPARLAELKRVAPEVEFIPVKTEEDAAKNVEDADAVLGFCTPEIVKAGRNLRWIQSGHAGVEKALSPELVGSKIVLTNAQRVYGPEAADQAFALLLSLTRGVRDVLPGEAADAAWRKNGARPQVLNDKTLLVVGLGGIGSQVARRGHAFGMRVLAIDAKAPARRADSLTDPRPLGRAGNGAVVEKPDCVFSLDKPAKLMELLPKADVVVLACPLTDATRGMIGAEQLRAMKPTAYLINVARGGLVKTPDLVEALQQKRIAGAGLDVYDPEPLPNGHPLTKLANVVVSPHVGGQSPEAVERRWRLWRENIRRFAVGEPLLCVVDKDKGY
ncbi:MAG TPA: NAD(P)-dependent oxidoreductase [Gemmataceae bacterium]|nr:NAD(P)-dependent oxidoreductase [Gemmataceae bacterium]